MIPPPWSQYSTVKQACELEDCNGWASLPAYVAIVTLSALQSLRLVSTTLVGSKIQQTHPLQLVRLLSCLQNGENVDWISSLLGHCFEERWRDPGLVVAEDPGAGFNWKILARVLAWKIACFWDMSKLHTYICKCIFGLSFGLKNGLRLFFQ